MHHRAAVAALCALLGCGAPARGPSSSPRPPEAAAADAPAPSEASDAALARALEAAVARPLAGLVTVDRAARIAPSRAVEPSEELGWRAWLAGAERRGRVVELVEDGGESVRVRTLAQQPCADAYATAAFYVLEGWVARAALLPVNEEDAVQLHPDGSGVLIRAGQVPVRGEDGALRVGHGELAVSVTPEQLGFAVAADHTMGSLADGLGGAWRELASVEGEREYEARVGGRLVLSRTCRSGFCDDRGPLAYTHFERAVGREQEGARHIVLGSRCVEVAAVVDALPRRGAGGLGGLGRGGRAPEACYTVARGVALEWEDGTRAGELLSEIRVSATSRPRAEPRTCSPTLIAIAAAPVCIRAEDLRDASCAEPLAW